MDAKEDVSFQDNYMYLKITAISIVFGFIAYQSHLIMTDRLNQMKARKEGRLDEYLEERYNVKKNSLRAKVFGEPEAPKNIKIGGQWQLYDLNGRKLSSESLSGHYYLLFFGSSLCPDVCPITLMKM